MTNNFTDSQQSQLDKTSESNLKIVPIFSGGGTKLSAHIGILSALEELQLDIEHIVGISGGSIVTALYCSGRSLNDIMKLAVDTDFSQFKGFSIYRLLKDGGLSNGDKFEKWIDDQLNGITFSELSHNLSIVATDVNGGGPVIFNNETSPKMKVSEAVRYSMSIPLVFTFKPYKDHLLVDGAILSEDALFREWSNTSAQNVCFRLKSENVTEKRQGTAFFHLPEYLLLLIKTFMSAMSREYVHAEYWQNTIVIDTQSMSSVDFSFTPAQKLTLFEMGKNTVLEILPIKLPNLFSNKP